MQALRAGTFFPVVLQVREAGKGESTVDSGQYLCPEVLHLGSSNFIAFCVHLAWKEKACLQKVLIPEILPGK